MTYKYCPNCGGPLNGYLGYIDPDPDDKNIFCQCKHCKEFFLVSLENFTKTKMAFQPPDRLAALREKYSQFTIPYLTVEIHNDVFELLDMLEAEKNSHQAHIEAYLKADKPGKYDYMETIGELIAEIERIRRD